MPYLYICRGRIYPIRSVGQASRLSINYFQRLRHELGLSLREIGQACNCGKTTVSEILTRAKNAEIVWPIDLSDKQLMSRLYPPTETKTSTHEPDIVNVKRFSQTP